MPRKNPLPRREKEISSRLRQIRAQSGMNKALFATHAGITPSRVNHYQTGAARVPFAVAMRICEFANINHTWLATGKGPESPAIRFHPELIAAVPEGMPYIEAYDRILGPAIKDKTGLHNDKSNCANSEQRQSAGSTSIETVLLTRTVLIEYLETLPPLLVRPFRERLEHTCRLFYEENESAIFEYWKTRTASGSDSIS